MKIKKDYEILLKNIDSNKRSKSAYRKVYFASSSKLAFGLKTLNWTKINLHS